MVCRNCSSTRVAGVSAKCSDMCMFYYNDKEYEGYVPSGLCIGEEGFIEFSYCLECGTIIPVSDDQGFPITDEDLKEAVGKT